MDSYVYRVNVEWYDEDTKQIKKEACFISAETYFDAISEVVDYFGEDEIVSIYCESYDSSFIHVSMEMGDIISSNM